MSRSLLWVVLLVLPLSGQAAERPLLPAKSEIGFSVKQMGVAVSGVFRRYSAKIDLDAATPEAASVQIEIETASLATGDAEADGVALDPAWLHAAGFPKASFRSDGVRVTGKDRYEARGTLSIRGKPRPMKIPFMLSPQADGSTVASGEFTLKRTDFGIGGGEWNEGDLVSPDVTVRFRLSLAAAP